MAGLLKVSILGANPGGEVWSVNPCFHSGTGDFPPTTTQLNTIATAINGITLSTSILTQMAQLTTVTGVRLEHRELSGALNVQFEAVRGAPVPGTGTTVHPMQTSAVVSLRTAGFGASSRGRLYWPTTSMTINPVNLRFAVSQRDSFLLGIKTYLTAIKTAINGTLIGYDLVVWSRKNAADSTVTKIMVGDVPDTQRRRRDTQIENYTETPW